MRNIVRPVAVIATVVAALISLTSRAGAAGPAEAKTQTRAQPQARVVSSTQNATIQTKPQIIEEEEDYVPPCLALALKVGTLGPGAELTLGLIPEALNIRLGGNYLPLQFSGKIKDVDYSVDLKWASVPLMLDYHPFYNNFRITGALMYNRNRARLDANLNDSQKIGEHEYTPEEIGTLSGSVDFRNFAPYVGIGFGNAVGGPDTYFNFVFDVGVMFQGIPGINLSSSGGTLSDDPAFLADLAQEEENVQDEADKFQFYPVISAGVSYQF